MQLTPYHTMRILTSLSKRNLIFLLFILNVCAVKGQNVSYYALTKTSRNGAISTNVSGGQFITFMGDICYESNKKGIGVGHGTLKLNTSYSNSNYKVYMGCSYWGQNAIFKFKSDLSTLNVVLENGDVYVYRKQTAPPSVTTCSLIRGKSSSSGSGSYTSSSSPTYQNNNPTYTPSGGNNNSGNSGGNSNTNRNNNNRQRRECSLCHGKRRIVRNSSVPTYGNDSRVRCNECGGYFMRSTGHSHVTCTLCHGRGYLE